MFRRTASSASRLPWMSEITAYISQVRRSLYGRLMIAKSRVLAVSTLSHRFVRMLRTIGPDRLVASQAGDDLMGFRAKKDGVPTAPHFTLSSQSGALVSLRNFLKERPVVLFFYPRMVPQAAPGRRALSETSTPGISGHVEEALGAF